MFGGCFLPQREVGRIAFFGLAVEFAGGGEEFVDVSSRKTAVTIVLVELGYIEIYGTFAHIGVAAVDNRFDVFNLLDYVARGMGLD